MKIKRELFENTNSLQDQLGKFLKTNSKLPKYWKLSKTKPFYIYEFDGLNDFSVGLYCYMDPKNKDIIRITIIGGSDVGFETNDFIFGLENFDKTVLEKIEDAIKNIPNVFPESAFLTIALASNYLLYLLLGFAKTEKNFKTISSSL